MTTASTTAPGWADLGKRVASGVVLASLAIGADVLGGWPFAIFWALAALVVLVEWEMIVVGGRRSIALGGLGVVAASVLAALAWPLAAVGVVAVTALAVLVARRKDPSPSIAAAGVFYAAAIAVPVILLRHDATWGSVAVIYLFAVVWLTDSMAYFVGRSVGGPKLWPAVSPKKTWSGFIGGTISGAIGGAVVVSLAGLAPVWPVFVLGLALAVVSQGGDLFESAIKRRYGAKDASRLIPGHGGAMDRLDGFVAAATVAVLVAAFREPETLAAGLLVW